MEMTDAQNVLLYLYDLVFFTVFVRTFQSCYYDCGLLFCFLLDPRHSVKCHSVKQRDGMNRVGEFLLGSWVWEMCPDSFVAPYRRQLQYSIGDNIRHIPIILSVDSPPWDTGVYSLSSGVCKKAGYLLKCVA